ncbi:MAG: Ig-like domain-containing protein, partial [Isosphaeraceae bacterium]
NDNAYILQLALVIGQQLPAPRAPTITKGTGHQVNKRVAITPLDAPTYVGSYEYGTTIQMVNVATGTVIGTAIVAKNGQYALHITTPLAVGKYHLAVRAVDEVGHVSHASRVFGLQVVPPKKHPA